MTFLTSRPRSNKRQKTIHKVTRPVFQNLIPKYFLPRLFFVKRLSRCGTLSRLFHFRCERCVYPLPVWSVFSRFIHFRFEQCVKDSSTSGVSAVRCTGAQSRPYPIQIGTQIKTNILATKTLSASILGSDTPFSLERESSSVTYWQGRGAHTMTSGSTHWGKSALAAPPLAH